MLVILLTVNIHSEPNTIRIPEWDYPDVSKAAYFQYTHPHSLFAVLGKQRKITSDTSVGASTKRFLLLADLASQ